MIDNRFAGTSMAFARADLIQIKVSGSNCMINHSVLSNRRRNNDSISFASSIVGGFADDCDVKFDEAYVSFVKRHFRHMRSWFECFQQIPEQDREDAVHDFFLSIRRKVRTPRSRKVLQSFIDDPVAGKRNFRKWLWTIAKHSAVDFIRARRNKFESIGGHESDEIVLRNLLCEQIESLLRDDFETMLVSIGSRVIGVRVKGAGNVSATDWELFVLGFWTPKRELARRFSKTERAIEQSYYRAKKGLLEIRGDILHHYGFTERFAIMGHDETI
jgi:DNA-directed RNA polymerase specialized sigma24 family protein